MTRRRSEDIVGSFLDNGTKGKGELRFSKTLRIDGNFHGSIVGEDRLIIGEQAVVHADIKVGDIEIRGQVFGNVEVRQAEILSGGFLRGDLHADTLIIQAGATFEGRSFKRGGIGETMPQQPSPDNETTQPLIQ